MDHLISELSGAPAGSVSSNLTLLNIGFLVFVAIGNLMLAHRNELGWWFSMLGTFFGFIAVALYPGSANWMLLLGAVPLFAVGAVGLALWAKHPLAGKFTRSVPVANFSIMGAIMLLIYTGVVALLQFGPDLAYPQLIFSETMQIAWLNFGLNALIMAGLLGVAFGSRWAWSLTAIGGIGMTVASALLPHLTGGPQPLLSQLFGMVLVTISAIYAWLMWFRPTPEPLPQPEDEDDED